MRRSVMILPYFCLTCFTAPHCLCENCQNLEQKKILQVPVWQRWWKARRHDSSVQVEHCPPCSLPHSLTLCLQAQQLRLQVTPCSRIVFETGGYCTDIYYVFQNFPRDFFE